MGKHEPIPVTAYVSGTELVITGDPNDSEDHSCDEMGCGQEHVLYRGACPYAVFDAYRHEGQPKPTPAPAARKQRKPCPKCGWGGFMGASDLRETLAECRVACCNVVCGFIGPPGDSPEAAGKAWDDLPRERKVVPVAPKPCPNPACGGTNCQPTPEYDITGTRWFVRCQDCRMAGPRCATAELADQRWNRLPRRGDPDPLAPIREVCEKFNFLDREIENVSNDEEPHAYLLPQIWRAMKRALGKEKP